MTNRKIARPDLIDLCRRGVVPVEKWSNRDSSGAQIQLGSALALLSAGCDYFIPKSPETDDRTIWVRIAFPGFTAFEEGHEYQEDELFYIPTGERLNAAEGGDWY